VSDLALGAVVVATVAMMIVPLPTFALDILITANIAMSVVLLMVSVYVASAMRITAFPTVLLLATLFRLGLNVTSARLILSQADAGEVIRAFGTAVVRGSFVVGAIVFVIVTIVQYVVIARGAERVAEVAARFTLDAMPGKQMAIDADLRTGMVDATEAGRRRQGLAREAQLYGAMDGAMRFVKGDAVAGILILVVCIAGGLAVGVAQRGLPVDEAFRTYAVLTIGDGLVSQIPALVTSTAAGLVVTRVASEDEGTRLAEDISTQFFAQPRALASAAGLLVLLSLVPGLPKVPFWILAAAAALAAWIVSRRRDADDRRAPAPVLRIETDGAVPRVAADIGVDLPVETVPRGAPGWRLSVSGIPVADGVDGDGLAAALRRHAHEALGIQEVQGLLDELSRTQPALVREVVPKAVTLAALTEVLRRLVAEGVPIADLRTILGALAGAKDRDTDALVERARVALRRAITYRLTDGKGAVSALLLDALVADAIGDGVVRGGDGAHLALEPDLARDIVDAVARATAGGASVLVTPGRIRRFTRDLLTERFPDLRVVSYDEILPEVKIEPAGRVVIA
jgi:type III secretion protein V